MDHAKLRAVALAVTPGATTETQREASREFWRTFNPPTVLALLDEIERLKSTALAEAFAQIAEGPKAMVHKMIESDEIVGVDVAAERVLACLAVLATEKKEMAAENLRLREALRPFAGCDPLVIPDADFISVTMPAEDYRRARAALDGKP